jgi:hypothetical protein
MKQLRDLTFECPVCKCEHNVRDWINDCLDKGLAVFNSEYAQEAYSKGILSLRYIGVHCDCGEDYAIEIYDGVMRVYHDDEEVFEEKYGRSSR